MEKTKAEDTTLLSGNNLNQNLNNENRIDT